MLVMSGITKRMNEKGDKTTRKEHNTGILIAKIYRNCIACRSVTTDEKGRKYDICD